MKDNLPLFLCFDIAVWTCDDDDTWLFKVCILGLFLHISNMQAAFCNMRFSSCPKFDIFQ